MTNVLHSAGTATAGAIALAAFFVLYHFYDNKYNYQRKYRNDGYVPCIFNYPIHIFLPFLNIIKSINVITANAAISSTIFAPPVNDKPI